MKKLYLVFLFFQLGVYSIYAQCTAPTVNSNPPNRSVCVGSTTTFSVSATGATSYQWQVDQTGGGSFTDLSNSAPYSGVTTNTLTITGATAGMTGYRYRGVAINAVATCFTNSNYGTLTVSAITTNGSQTNVTCNGNYNGAASVSASGGIVPYTYSWSPSGGSNSTATGLGSGSYTVTVTDGIGCSVTRNFIITQPSSLTMTASSQTNVSCNGGSNGAATVNVPSGGLGGYTYNWTPGNPSGDGTRSVTNLTAGTWTCTVTDANGCTRSQNFTITAPPAISGLSALSQTNVSCNGGANGAAAVSVASGGSTPYTYNWTPGNPSGDGTTNVTGLTAGTWTCTVTDANGCTKSQNFTITAPPAISGLSALSQTNVSCNGGSNGAAAVSVASGGSPPYTYNWTPGNPSGDGTTNVTGLTAGTWTCTVTDANGCTKLENFIITEPPTPVSGTTVVTNVACFGGNTGSINLTPTGGVGPYTYDWGGGVTTEDRVLLTAGTYSVTITDANGCTGIVSGITLTQPAAPVSGTTVVTNVACFGGNTGSINLTPTGGVGPYTYDWGGGITTEDRVLLTAGTYSVTITDANGCTGTVSGITLTQPAAPVSGTTVVTNVACFGGNTGSINLTPTGGVGPYTYNWGGGVTTEDRVLLTAGTYSVTITDANGCTGTVSGITLTQPAAPVFGTTVVTNVACFGGNTGSINLTPTGGVGPYTYDWGGGITTEDRTSLLAGTYSVTITDVNGCIATQSFTITEPSELVATAAAQTNVSCFGGSNGAATVNVTGGTGAYTYLWSNAETTATITGLSAGTYSVTVTDASGCTSTANVTIDQPLQVIITDQPKNATIGTEGNAVYTVTALNADAYQWQVSSDGTSWIDVVNGGSNPAYSGETTASLTISSVPVSNNGYLYRVTVINGTNCIILSDTALLTINNVVEAVNDDFSNTSVIEGIGGMTGDVTANDLFNNLAVNDAGITTTILNSGGLTGVSINTDGNIIVPAISTAGTYTITYQICDVTLGTNCSTAEAIVVISPALGTAKVNEMLLTIYPNPASATVYIKLDDFAAYSNLKAVIYDLNGRLIRKDNVNAETFSVDVTGLEAAVYILDITSDTAKATKRILINKKR